MVGHYETVFGYNEEPHFEAAALAARKSRRLTPNDGHDRGHPCPDERFTRELE